MRLDAELKVTQAAAVSRSGLWMLWRTPGYSR